MAYDLTQLQKPDASRPVICTIFGEAGVGKTTLAATFPKPVIIRTEDGTTSLAGREDVSLFPVAATSAEVFAQIEALATGEHDFESVVLDSVTQLSAIVEAEIVATDPKAKSIAPAGGGYGAGYLQVADVNHRIREWMGALATDRKMNVVFLGHADTETMDLPDSDPYSRYTVRLHKKTLPAYVDNVDLVGFLRMKTMLRGGSEDKVKRALSTGERELICHPQAANVSKNRFGITEPMTFDPTTNPIAGYVPALNKGN